MMETPVTFDWAIAGGLASGLLAGGAARFGRLCTMSAIEDALVGHDFRGAKAWGLALAVAIAATQLGALAGAIELVDNPYSGRQVHMLGAALGGLVFGLGMTLVGTCSFGLIVRAGSGDLRALAAGVVVGIFAFAITAGALAPLRAPLLDLGVFTLPGATIDGALGQILGSQTATAIIIAGLIVLAILPVADRRLRARPRLLTGSVALGLAVTLGWWTTSRALDALTLDRIESLSFVAPVGRALLQFMIEPFRNIGFGVSALFGVALASFAVAAWRRELRWEAFDDAREMRRHLFGAALMGIGGVLAHGCTIGQGLSAASTLAITAPVFMVAVLIGAKIGLKHLIEGQSMWRIGRPARSN